VVHHAAPAFELRGPATAALAAVAVVAGGCGNAGEAAAPSPVAWVGKPLVVRQPQIPDDTIVSGRMLNRSRTTLLLDAADVRVLDPDGNAVRSTARFSLGVTHPLYPPRDTPREANPRFEAERLGQAATVKAGKSVPFVVSWRVGAGEPQPVKVDLGGGASLKLPGH
jgi:hypothetical protein